VTNEEPSSYRTAAVVPSLTSTVGPVYPVSEVTRYLRELLEHDRHLSGIWVSGEISNLNLASSGHAYFTLKDDRGALRCAFFRNRNAGQRERLENGASYLVHGSLSLYEVRGELSFVVEFVQPEGVGALQAEFERRKARFEEEGLFALDRKRALPRFPERVGVVTSATGAVFHDIQTVLDRRWPMATLLLQPTAVQGPEAAPMIADSIRLLDREHTPDVIIVARGGGSWEELWPFNEEPVVRAIHGARAPVVSAVGHETDTTLADLVADVRAATPSAAAELVSPDRVEIEREVDARVASAGLALTRRVARAHESTAGARARLVRGLPNIERGRERVAALAERGLRGTLLARARRDERISAYLDRLRALSPLATLERAGTRSSSDRAARRSPRRRP
jgi:exodeoxyribonuclease VII large subunit